MNTFPRRLIAVFAAVVLAVAAGSAWYTRNRRESFQREAERELQTVMRLKVDQIVAWRAERLANAFLLMESPLFNEAAVKWMETPNPTVMEQLLNYFRALQKHYHYRDVLLVDACGQARLSLSGRRGRLHEEAMQAMVAVLRDRRAVLTDLHAGPGDLPPHLDVIAPLPARNAGLGEATGAIILQSNAREFLYPMVQPWPVPSPTAEALLVRRDGGDVLFISELRHKRDTALKLHIPLNRTEVPAVMAALRKEDIMAGRDYRGVEVLACLKAIPDSPWMLVAKKDLEEIYAPMRQRLWTMGIIIALLIMTVALTIGFSWHQLAAKRERNALAERIAYLSRHANDIMLFTDQNWGIAEANERALAAYGYSHDELQGLTLGDLHAPESREAFDRQAKQVDRQNGMIVETVHQRKDGSTFPVESSMRAVELEGKRFHQAIIRNITERKQAEKAVKQSSIELHIRNRITQMFLTVPDEEMYAQVLAIILDVMESKYGIFGYLDELGGLVVPTMTRIVWDKCQVPDKRIVFPLQMWGESSWPRAIRERRTICLNEPSTLIPQGHISITRHISMPLIHQDQVVGLIQVANKETEYSAEDVALLQTIGGAIAPVLDARLKRERQEEKLKRALADLERSNRELEQFAYIASHDLQEPLRMVASYTQLLADRYEGKLDDKARKYITYAVDGATRMQRLIGDLLTYSRVGTRGGPLLPIDSHAALGEALRNLAAAIVESHALITNDDLPAVRADASQLAQVFQNLLGNAIKFHGPDLPRIHVAAKEQNQEWIFSVQDNGIGIDQQYKEKIFVIFQRLHTRQEYPGTGIGLALCRRIIERHDGRIWFESDPGKGSTFFFTLPK